jgi:hypothetical protein
MPAWHHGDARMASRRCPLQILNTILSACFESRKIGFEDTDERAAKISIYTNTKIQWCKIGAK